MRATWRERVTRTLRNGVIYFAILAALVYLAVPERPDQPTYSMFRNAALAIAAFGGLLLMALSMSSRKDQ